jgi:hypothetical protein
LDDVVPEFELAFQRVPAVKRRRLHLALLRQVVVQLFFEGQRGRDLLLLHV